MNGPQWEAFARQLLCEWPDALEVDMAHVQSMAEDHGILIPESRVVPCDDDPCSCARDVYSAGETVTCYRVVPAADAPACGHCGGSGTDEIQAGASTRCEHCDGTGTSRRQPASEEGARQSLATWKASAGDRHGVCCPLRSEPGHACTCGVRYFTVNAAREAGWEPPR